MKRLTLYTQQYVDCEYDVNFEDIIELVESCNDREKEEIRIAIGAAPSFQINAETLYDLEKTKLLKAAFEKYNLDQLMEKLEMKYIDY